MPIDPQAQAHLDIAFGHANAGTRAWSARTLPTPPQLASVVDRQVAAPGGPVTVRVFTPEGDGPLPVAIWIHGGGWVQGSIDTNDATCRFLAEASGAIVVSVEYRLSPMTKFPGALDDCYAVAEWIASDAASIRGDASRVAICGASAGGNLATVIALRARDSGGPKFVHQLMVYPVTDSGFNTETYELFATGHLLDRDQMKEFFTNYLPNDAERSNPYVAPMKAEDLSGLPPAHIITAEYDVLRDEGEAYGARLVAAGVPVRHSRYLGMIHTFFNGTIGFDKTFEAITECGAELRKAFGTA
jgi:acetyl esterase